MARHENKKNTKKYEAFEQPAREWALVPRRHAVEEIHDSRIERVFGANDDELAFLDQRLENFRSMSQMIG